MAPGGHSKERHACDGHHDALGRIQRRKTTGNRQDRESFANSKEQRNRPFQCRGERGSRDLEPRGERHAVSERDDDEAAEGRTTMLATHPISGTPPNHHQTIGAVATSVRALTTAALLSLRQLPVTRGALKIADVDTMESKNAGRSAIAGSGPERRSTTAAATGTAEGRRPSATKLQVSAAVVAARQALGAPPANAACRSARGAPIPAATRRASNDTESPRTAKPSRETAVPLTSAM